MRRRWSAWRRERALGLCGGAEALLVHSPENLRYLCGFRGEGFLVLREDGCLLLTDPRYGEEAADEGVERRTCRGPWREVLAEVLEGLRVAVEPTLPLGLARQLEARGVRLEVAEALRGLRAVKDEGELEHIERAARLAEAALRSLLSEGIRGRSERELAWELERRMREGGSEQLAFPPIVASGPNAALPHARPTERRLDPGDLVVVDLGARLEGYCSDETVTLSVGPPSAEARRLHRLVWEAQRRVLDAVRPGMRGREVHALACQVFEREGMLERFLHGTGHGVGLEVHESPALGPGSEEVLEEGMVFTVEPGLYVPGFGGVRLEDTVVLRREGAEPLTSLPKELWEV